MTELAHHGDRGTSENDVAPLKRLRRPKTVSADFTPRANDILQDYRKTPLVSGKKELHMSIEDEALDESISSGTKDTLANLRVQMDNLVGQLLQDAPIQMQPEWLAEPRKYRRYVLSNLPGPDSTLFTPKIDAWLKQFSRLVALDVRAKRLGKVQFGESPFWREVLEHDIAKKRVDYESLSPHNTTINTRAQELYDDWKALSAEGRDALKRENDKVRAHQKFVLLRAQDTCRAKQYNSLEEAERDAQMLDTLGDNILVKDRFAQLVETSSERAATVTAEFDEDEPTILKPRVKSPVPPKPGFFRRMTAPFVAAASLLVGLGGAQQTAERTTDMLSQPDTKEQAYEPAPLPVVERSETKASDGQATVRANEERPSESVSGKQATHVVEKGDRLWDVARQEIADERGVDLKRVARDDREILPRVQALKILNDIDDATKLKIGTELKLEETKAPVAKEAPIAAASRLDATPGASIESVADLVSKLDAAQNGSSDAPREVIKSRGDTAWAHADSMLRDAKVRPTHARRQLVAALMLRESGNLNAYKLRIGQELSTTRANAAIEQLKNGKNPSDIARAAGLPWPPKNLSR